jgi:hypothetical protein
MNITRKDELTTLKERCAKLFAEQNKYDNIMQVEQLQFSGKPRTEREKEVFQIKALREKAYQRLEHVLNKINAAKRGDEAAAEYNMADLQEKKAAIFEEINKLPDLGYTYAEWNDASDDVKKKRVGRPVVSLEQKIIRARNGADELMTQIAAIQGHPNMDEVFAMAEDPSVIEKKNGRPPFDTLGKIDYDLKVLRSKIDYIVSGQAEVDIQEKLKTAKYSKDGKRLGRAFQDPAMKLEKLRATERKMVRMITRMEEALSGIEMLNRQLKLKKDYRNELRRLVKNGVDQTANEANLNAVLNEIRALEASIDQMGSEGRRTKQYEQQDTSVLAPKPATVKSAYVPRNTTTAVTPVEDIVAPAPVVAEDVEKHRKHTDVTAWKTPGEENRAIKEGLDETRSVVHRLMKG